MGKGKARAAAIASIIAAAVVACAGCAGPNSGVNIGTGRGKETIITMPTATPSPTATLVPTVAPLVVHVAGAVAMPGVYVLEPEARVIDAVEAAGGMLPTADDDAVNLADHVRDGMQLVIPEVGIEPSPSPTPIPVPAGKSESSGLVNINTASAAELEALPHIGPALAGRIVTYRESNGLFQHIDQLEDVSGIGPACMSDLRELITVD